jgi:hypothetical protein
MISGQFLFSFSSKRNRKLLSRLNLEFKKKTFYYISMDAAWLCFEDWTAIKKELHFFGMVIPSRGVSAWGDWSFRVVRSNPVYA